ncbi:carbon catabolite repressor protein 4 homolog 6 isoform X1 [Dendrobium catenatum]|uniref:carbon catabolite repressor protein 4 homolog 6 isoform X1 n=2 Tax=Dendrobium catenatum TaxID=906689 RepID=UPI0009F36BFD|nr:carbon catabolite repressor protein 4 homolog 6 isoform X1 [Dendrobium catenatum]XP_028556454.1 carbon catabolite repressor protein 4 homolog 6 isoform X1 [Dendrobium catenatum]XP_028556455.1 carbon catabolite repressor protein 4 homolog 6 isoform X1 [Dendrobium catenatum]
MSPLYKFIATQKLNLSGLARDHISGQYSATLQSRPKSYYSLYRPQTFGRYASQSTFGAQESYCKTRLDSQYNMRNSSPTEKASMISYQDVEQKAHGQISPGATTIKLGGTEVEVSSTYPELANMHGRTSEICSQHDNIDAGKNSEEVHILHESCSDHKVSRGCADLANEIKQTSTSNMDNSTAAPIHNSVSHSFQMDRNTNGNPPPFCSYKEDFSTVDSSKVDTLSEEKSCTSCAILEAHMVENKENSITGSAVTEKAGSIITCHYSGEDNKLDVYNFDGSHVSDRMSIISCIEDDKIMGNMDSCGHCKKVSSDKILEEIPVLFGNLSEDATSTKNSQSSKLPGLEENEVSQSPELFGMEENADSNFFKELLGVEDDNQTLKDVNSSNAELQENSSFPLASAVSNVERRFYNPYWWSPMEMEIASGKEKCTIVEHPWKLRSVYTDVEDYAGTKDSSREPQVTSYNQQFMGTVDYIWCSEELQTVKVLDTIPRHVLQRTPGFPTQKWGSDHIALACELAFSKGSQNK